MSTLLTSRFMRWRAPLRRLRAYGRGAFLFLGGISVALVTVLIYHLLVPEPRPLTTNDVNSAIVQALASVTPPPAYSASVYQTIRLSFVLIRTQSPGSNGDLDHGIGSGVLVSERGDILTSLHVVADATAVRLTFVDGTESSARLIASQPERDIAVLRATQLPAVVVPATLGNPNAMRPGDEAYVVGNPLGLYSSVTAGVISGFGRSFLTPDGQRRIEGLIQFDAAVNPGNSGGPLLNRAGQVIGIVIGLENPTEQNVFIGIGLAVPIDVAGGAAGMPQH